MQTRFVILFPLRTGSTFIMYGLNQNRDVKCLFEIFGSYMSSVYESNITVSTGNVSEYVDSIFSRQEQRRIRGFKLSHSQFQRYPNLLNIMRRDRYKVIHLYRKNVLDRVISLELAQITNEWVRKKEETQESIYNKIKINIPRDYLLSMIQRDQDELNDFRKKFSTDFDWYETHYEDVCNLRSDEIMGEMQEFLGATPVKIAPLIVKQNQRSPEEIIGNYDEIKDLANVEIG